MGKVKVLGPQAGYVELLDHYTKEKMKTDSEGPKRYMPLRPSASGKCAKELAYEYDEYLNGTKYEKELDSTESYRLLDFGNSVEYHVLKQFKDAFKLSNIQIKYQQQKLLFFKLSNGEYVEGSIDSVFVHPKWKVLIDVKSKKDKFSAYFTTNWVETSDKLRKNKFVTEFGVESFWIEDLEGFLTELNDPFWAMNFYQLNLYFFDEQSFLRNIGVDHAALLYYNKNSSEMREIRFKPSQASYDKVKEKFLRVDQAMANGKKPDDIGRDYALGSIKCAFCKFSKYCWSKDTDTLKAYFQTFSKKKWPTDIDRIKNPARVEMLRGLHAKYKEASQSAENLENIERQIVQLLLDEKIFKIKFAENEIYEVKELKTGGPKNGPRMVLRRGKV